MKSRGRVSLLVAVSVAERLVNGGIAALLPLDLNCSIPYTVHCSSLFFFSHLSKIVAVAFYINFALYKFF